MTFVSGNLGTVNNVVKNASKTPPTCVLANIKLTRSGLIHHKFLALLYCYTFLWAVSIFTTIHFDTFKLNIPRGTSLTLTLTDSVSDDGTREVNVVVCVYKRCHQHQHQHQQCRVFVRLQFTPIRGLIKTGIAGSLEPALPEILLSNTINVIFSHQSQTCKH